MWIGIDGRVLQEETFGGVREYAKNILCSLLRLDTKNQYVVFTNKWGKQKGLELPTASNLYLVCFRYPNKLLNLSLLVLGAPRLNPLIEKEIFKQTGQKIKIDLFWAPNINFIRLRPGIRFFLTVHDLSFFVEPSFFSLKQRFLHAFVRPNELFKRTDVLLPVSEATKIDLERLGAGRERSMVIYPGVGEEFFNKNIELEREAKKLYSLPDRFIFSFAVNGKRKNLEGVINAFKNASLPSDLHLVIAGVGTEILTNNLEVTLNRIHFLGSVSDKLRPALYRLALMFVYPSFYEGFGLPVIEAMDSGTPVVTSAVTSLPEAASGAAILVDPHDVGELSAAMEALFSSAALRDKLIAKGTFRVSNFTWNSSARHLLEQFEK